MCHGVINFKISGNEIHFANGAKYTFDEFVFWEDLNDETLNLTFIKDGYLEEKLIDAKNPEFVCLCERTYAKKIDRKTGFNY